MTESKIEPLLSPVHCIGGNLYKTARAVSRIYADEMRPAGLARSQFAILGNLEQTGPVALTALAETLVMDRTTLSRNLKPLVSAGLVARESSAADARVSLLRITGKGRGKFQAARRYWRRAQRRLLDLLGEREWQALETELASLRDLVGRVGPQ